MQHTMYIMIIKCSVLSVGRYNIIPISHKKISPKGQNNEVRVNTPTKTTNAAQLENSWIKIKSIIVPNVWGHTKICTLGARGSSTFIGIMGARKDARRVGPSHCYHITSLRAPVILTSAKNLWNNEHIKFVPVTRKGQTKMALQTVPKFESTTSQTLLSRNTSLWIPYMCSAHNVKQITPYKLEIQAH